MLERLDMTGQPCPIPVVKARQLLAKPEVLRLEVLVDNHAAVQNLKKMADGLGYTHAYTKQGDKTFCVVLEKSSSALPEPAPAAAAIESPVLPKLAGDVPAVILVTREVLGGGDEALGRMLMKGFIFSLTELAYTPRCVIFINGGAMLTTQGAATVDDLTVLEEKGCRVLTCGTCTDFYNITDALAVGAIANMMEIATLITGAQRLVSL